jgi:hypothetical protein
MMANGNGGANAFLAFIVGGLVVFVALVFVFGWGTSNRIAQIELPAIDRTR